MINQAMKIKSAQDDSDLRIVASAWTAPPWMKDIEDWYVPGTPENNYQGTGGALKPEYVQTYADYVVRYLDAYRAEGVEIWGLTPVNEPHGNSGNWESMHFTPETQNEFIKQNLAPALRASDFDDVKVLIYDQNRDDLEHWADEIFGDPETAQHSCTARPCTGTRAPTRSYEDVLERVHQKFPDFAIIHTEGTIDDLGKERARRHAGPGEVQGIQLVRQRRVLVERQRNRLGLHGRRGRPTARIIRSTRRCIGTPGTSSSASTTGWKAGSTGTSSWTGTADPTTSAISAARRS